jgi:hypothetical protein
VYFFLKRTNSILAKKTIKKNYTLPHDVFTIGDLTPNVQFLVDDSSDVVHVFHRGPSIHDMHVTF